MIMVVLMVVAWLARESTERNRVDARARSLYTEWIAQRGGASVLPGETADHAHLRQLDEDAIAMAGSYNYQDDPAPLARILADIEASRKKRADIEDAMRSGEGVIP